MLSIIKPKNLNKKSLILNLFQNLNSKCRIKILAIFFHITGAILAAEDFDFLIVPRGEVFAKSESEFLLTIPDVFPEKVRVEFAPQENAKLISQKKFETVEIGGKICTQIQFLIEFENAGEISLEPVSAVIGEKSGKIAFAPFVVSENPSLIVPELFAQISENAQAFKKARLSVFVRGAKKILSISAKLPPNSIFEEKSRALFEDNDLPSEKILVAEFDWTPLSAGKIDFPEILAETESFLGEHFSISLAPQTLFAKESELSEKDDFSKDSAISSAFEPISKENENSGEKNGISAESAKKIAHLRSLEKKSLPFSNARKNRIEFEKQNKIESNQNEPSKPLFAVLFFAFLAFLIFATALAFFKKRIFVLCAFAAVLSGIFAFREFSLLSKKSVVVFSQKLYSIPESSGSFRQISSGVRAEIAKKTSGWICVKTEIGSGWVLETDAILIE